MRLPRAPGAVPLKSMSPSALHGQALLVALIFLNSHRVYKESWGSFACRLHENDPGGAILIPAQYDYPQRSSWQCFKAWSVTRNDPFICFA